MSDVARNFAQLVFLAYCLWLVYRSQKVVRSLLLIRMSERDLAKNSRGLVNKSLFLRLKKRVPPLFYWLNFAAVCLFACDLALQILFGWFHFAAVFLKIVNSLTVICCGLYGYLAALTDSLLRHDKLFVLYNWDPDGDRIFSSGLLDILLCVIGPVAIVVSNVLM